MDRIEHVFAALSERMSTLPTPERTALAPESLTSLIAKVNAAKRLYESGARR